jgi:L-ascorbate metabolism protein UlaG (beta-lactamase superfamily)
MVLALFGLKGDCHMNRRLFLHRILTAGKMAILMGLLPSGAKLQAGQGTGELDYKVDPLPRMSLGELVKDRVHHGDGRFLNPFSTKEHGNMLRVLHWKLFSKNDFRSYYDQEQVVPVNIDWEPIRDHANLSITFLKHSSLMIKDQNQYLLVDPVFFEIFPFIKDFTPLGFNLADMPRPDHVLLTHGHYDHLHTRSLAALSRDTHVITPLGYNDIFSELKMNHRTQLDWLDTYRDGRGEITLMPCDHWTMRNPFEGPNTSLWGGFLLKSRSGPTIYISGETAYFDRFREIGQEYSIDLAVMNLGAYEPRWFMAGSHMNPSETVRAFKELGAKRLLVVHWGTFRLGDEPVHFPPMEIKKAMEKEGLLDRLVQLNHGETLYM